MNMNDDARWCIAAARAVLTSDKWMESNRIPAALGYLDEALEKFSTSTDAP